MSDLFFKNNEFNNYKHKISGTVFTHPYGEKNLSRTSQMRADLTRLKQIFYKIHVVVDRSLLKNYIDI